MSLSVLPFLEKLPDRQTAQNLVYRIDWKLALCIEVDVLPGIQNRGYWEYYQIKILELLDRSIDRRGEKV